MSFNLSEMDNMTKMMLFAFLGIIFAIMVLGFHASPPASPALGAATRTNVQSASSLITKQGNQNPNRTTGKGGFY